MASLLGLEEIKQLLCEEPLDVSVVHQSHSTVPGGLTGVLGPEALEAGEATQLNSFNLALGSTSQALPPVNYKNLCSVIAKQNFPKLKRRNINQICPKESVQSQKRSKTYALELTEENSLKALYFQIELNRNLLQNQS